MNFNEKQRDAIYSHIDKNLIISAGAGSGKTKTLAERVYHIISSGVIDPANLLVLTFTDNAAFEMKERIIANFKCDNNLNADKILSAHIQTFDSFNSYLVKKYSSKLLIPSNFSILNDFIFKTKFNEILEEIIAEYINNYESNDDFAVLFRNYFDKTGLNLRNAIKYIYLKLDALSEEEFYSFNKDYDSNYKDENIIRAKYEKFILSSFKDYINYFENRLINLNLPSEFNYFYDIHHFYKQKNVRELCSTLINAKRPRSNTKVYKSLLEEDKNAVAGGNAFLKEITENVKKFVNINEQIYDIKHFQNVEHLLIEIITKINIKLDEYKKINNVYTFTDISKLALRLLKDPKFSDIKEEIQNTFKYVMVDEYQDTNDIQEDFINEICKKGHNFIVGDLKQSIYAFRNANCELFINRKNNYRNSPSENIVIDMNTNYRSFPQILRDCNKLFVNYMEKDNGGTNYSLDEFLIYDKKVDLFNRTKLYENGKYGVQVIENVLNFDIANNNPIKTEFLQIIFDIISKIRSNYQVLDLEKGGLRNCTFKDFAIICKKKKYFSDIKELFNEYNIPLNITFDEVLRDINSILVLENLIKLVKAILSNEKDYKHYYLSLARSYIYELSDEEIYNTIINNKIEESTVFKDVLNFVNNNKNEASFTTIFHNLIEDFHIIEYLYKLGDVVNNVNKIEELSNIVNTISTNGEGINEFIELFNNISKFNIEVNNKNNIVDENSVTLTTIHGSKGLEYKIIYVPSFGNDKRSESNKNGIDFNKDYGIVLKNNTLGMKNSSFYKQLIKDNQNQIEKDEFVRLIYVLFTRAKESIYLVLNNYDSDLKDIMLSNFEYTIYYDEDIIKKYNLLTKEELALLKAFSRGVETLSRLYESYSLHELNNEDFKKRLKAYISHPNLTDHAINMSYSASNFYEVKKIYFNDLKNECDKFIEEFEIKMKGRLIHYLISDEQYKTLAIKLADALNIKLEDIDLKTSLNIIISIINESNSPILEYRLLGPEYKTFDQETNLEPFECTTKETFNFKIDDTNYEFPIKVTKRASKQLVENNEEIERFLEFGTRLHYYMELVDFSTKDTSFIEDKKEKQIIDNCLKMPIFNFSDKASVFKEYQYLNDNNNISIIDLLVIDEDIVKIIDYKAKNIDDTAYDEQLSFYEDYIAKIFASKKIEKYLVSLIDAKYRKI